MMNTGSGDIFRDSIINEIKSWKNENIEIGVELDVGFRFVDKPRKLDIVLRNKLNNKFIGIEAKYQQVSGTAYQKISYAIEDCKLCPIPTIIVFSGKGIVRDMKHILIASGIGIEVGYDENFKIIDKYNLFKQRVYMELGLNWFEIMENKMTLTYTNFI